MVKIRGEQINEIKYPMNLKHDNLIEKLNCHVNPNKWKINNSNNVYNDKDDNYDTFNFNNVI